MHGISQFKAIYNNIYSLQYSTSYLYRVFTYPNHRISSAKFPQHRPDEHMTPDLTDAERVSMHFTRSKN